MTHDEMIAVIKSYDEGKTVQMRGIKIQPEKWNDNTFPGWNFQEFEYRVKPDANDSTPMNKIDLNLTFGNGLSKPAIAPSESCEQSEIHPMKAYSDAFGGEQKETFDWKTAAKLWAEGVDIQIRGTISWADFLRDECATFLRLGTYRRKPSPVTPDKKEEELPASETTEDHPSRAYLLGRIENLENNLRELRTCWPSSLFSKRQKLKNMKDENNMTLNIKSQEDVSDHLSAHYADCTIFASMVNKMPTDGICTCGYGLRLLRKGGDSSQMFSEERMKDNNGCKDDDQFPTFF